MRARDNPYRAERLHSLFFRLEGTTWERLLLRFQDLGGQGCVWGPHGSGKTTLLLALAALLRKQGHPVDEHSVRADIPLPDPEPILSSLAADRVVILDGADLLRPADWRRIQNSRAGSLIVSSHKKRLLPILYRCRPTPELLEDLMRELHPVSACSQPTGAQLYCRHRGNLREALLELYDFHAANPDCGPYR